MRLLVATSAPQDLDMDTDTDIHSHSEQLRVCQLTKNALHYGKVLSTKGKHINFTNSKHFVLGFHCELQQLINKPSIMNIPGFCNGHIIQDPYIQTRACKLVGAKWKILKINVAENLVLKDVTVWKKVLIFNERMRCNRNSSYPQ